MAEHTIIGEIVLPAATAIGGAFAAGFAVVIKRWAQKGIRSANKMVSALDDDDREEAAETAPDKASHSECIQPCESHIVLKDSHAELKGTIGVLSEAHENLKANFERLDKSVSEGFSEIFQRFTSVEQSVLKVLERQTDIIQGMGDSRADMAFLKAKMDKKHAVEHIVPVVENMIRTNEHLLLFVDDNVDSLMPITTMLELEGFSVSKAKTYNEAQGALEAVPFRYAIIDASLSPASFDGVQLASWASKTYRDLKVVIYSGYELEQIPARCAYVDKREFGVLIETMKRYKKEADDAARKTQ
jgi:CheY-like chemotaxis protein